MRYFGFLLAISIRIMGFGINIPELDPVKYESFSLNISSNANSETVTDLISNALHLNTPENLTVSNEISNGGTRHITFEHRINGIPVLGSGVKVHIYNNSTALVQNYLLKSSDYSILEVADKGRIYCPVSGVLYPCIQSINYELRFPRIEYRFNGKLVFATEESRYYRDTSAIATVFYPNPIISAKATYGGMFADSNNRNLDSLQAQLKQVNIKVRWDNDSFYLEHELFKFEELGFPFHNDDYKLPTDSFLYSRDHPRFEALNAYYHLSVYIDYLTEMGYNSLVKPFTVDVHGRTDDNSEFNPTFYSLVYGDGGVDDAEDPEVLIHEFGHLMSETGSPNTVLGTQRKAMEEGLADYIGKSYSRSYSEYLAYDIYTWDGHNEFWDGYVLNSDRRFPEDMVYTKEGDREIWSSFLFCIRDYLGMKKSDSLVFEYLFYLTSGMTFDVGAALLLEVDSIAFEQRNSGYIKECMIIRGFAKRPVSIQEQQNKGINITNSYGFMTGVSSLEISSKSPVDIRVYNSQGQLVLSQEKEILIILDPMQFESGVYFAIIRKEGEIISVKMLRN